ncbi:Uncharacterized protein APZ42_010166 [Daphnia magna]|uniref:Uncharacterized protein n=1 Tax=Daphnia magna TaxID=35525 RepID=A0A164DJ45_9CRUS|nr:Uncharacterized protein APZ42_010166 [Daphnia magna]
MSYLIFTINFSIFCLFLFILNFFSTSMAFVYFCLYFLLPSLLLPSILLCLLLFCFILRYYPTSKHIAFVCF